MILIHRNGAPKLGRDSLCGKATENYERELSELTAKISSLQTQNSYLTTMVDTQEEEKNRHKGKHVKSV